jgi:hypothetical protein
MILSCVVNLMLHSKVGEYSYPGKSCLDILQRTKEMSLSNGEYWIVLDSRPLKVYCDMKADGGIYLHLVYFYSLCFELHFHRFSNSISTYEVHF